MNSINKEKESILENFKKEFEKINIQSRDKDDWRSSQIKGYSSILFEELLKLPSLSEDDAPLLDYSIEYNSKTIFLIRQFYIRYIRKGSDESDLDMWNDVTGKTGSKWNNWLMDLNNDFEDYFAGPSGPFYYLNLMLAIVAYIDWLKGNQIGKKKYPEKFYAWYHAIKIALGKEDQFPNNFTMENIIEFGKNRYSTGETFYREIGKLDLTKTISFVNSLSKRDRSRWKNIIIDISNNDADIVNYLKKFPN